MTDFDPYSEKIADICSLIRQHGQCEAWELFKNSERGLEVLCAIVDAVRAEAKAAVPVTRYPFAEQEFLTALFGAKGDLDAWLECNDEAECRKIISPLVSLSITEQTKRQEPK